MEIKEMLGKEILIKSAEDIKCEVKGLVIGIDENAEDSFFGKDDLFCLVNVHDMIEADSCFRAGLDREWVKVMFEIQKRNTTDMIPAELEEDLIPVWIDSQFAEVL